MRQIVEVASEFKSIEGIYKSLEEDVCCEMDPLLKDLLIVLEAGAAGEV